MKEERYAKKKLPYAKPFLKTHPLNLRTLKEEDGAYFFQSMELFEGVKDRIRLIESYDPMVVRQGNYKEIQRVRTVEKGKKDKISYYGAITKVDLKCYAKVLDQY